ncbi:FCD domain-containing protein [Bacillus atrophaeus]|nr:FCD domain-containing protein [Bacillus atrophaeus]
MNANERFHEIIIKASHNPVMIDIIDRNLSHLRLKISFQRIKKHSANEC